MFQFKDGKGLILKSLVGPTGFSGVTPEERFRAEFTLDNNCQDVVPKQWWEEIKENYFSVKNNLKFKEAFRVVGEKTVHEKRFETDKRTITVTQ